MNDFSMFTYTKGKDFIVLLVYVDDVIIAGTSTDLISQIKKLLILPLDCF